MNTILPINNADLPSLKMLTKVILKPIPAIATIRAYLLIMLIILM